MARCGSPLAAITVIAVMLSACGSPAAPPASSTSATASPRLASADATLDTTPAPTPTIAPATPTLQPMPTPPVMEAPAVIGDAVARVTVDGLRVRADPGTDGEEVARLISGDLVWVWAGPVASDGRTWYDVGGQGIRGWVAAGVVEDPWLVGAPDEDAAMLATLRLDTCTILCNEVVWYEDPRDPNAARLVRRTVDITFPGGLLDGERLVAGAGELLWNILQSGLLDESRTFEPRLLPGQTPAGYGDDVNRRFVRRTADGEIITVGWRIPVESQRYERQPEADALEELARGIDGFFAP